MRTQGHVSTHGQNTVGTINCGGKTTVADCALNSVTWQWKMLAEVCWLYPLFAAASSPLETHDNVLQGLDLG